MTDLVTLSRFWNGSSRDNATTTDGMWGDRADKPGYELIRREARIFAAENPPAGTVALHRWFSASRSDHYTTSHPDWRGDRGATRSPDYQWEGIEGYVYERPHAGTTTLYSWYHDRGDNRLTTHEDWVHPQRRRYTRRRAGPAPPNDGYRFSRVEGYAIPATHVDLARLGHGAQRPDSVIDVVALIVDLTDLHVDFDDSHFQRLLLGQGYTGTGQLVTLNTWYSPTRSDFFTTSDDDWDSLTVDERDDRGWGSRTTAYPGRSPDFRYVRTEGFAFDASGGSPPPGVVELRRYFHPPTRAWRTSTEPVVRVSAPPGSGTRTASEWKRRTTEVWVFDPKAPQPAGTVPLHGWSSRRRADFFTTSDEEWHGGPGATRAPDYVWDRVEGYVYPTVQPNTVPLCNWYSRSGMRHYLGAKGLWAIAHRAPDYRQLKIEGRVFSPLARQRPGTVPLWTWWNTERGGHLTTTDPEWEGQPGDERGPFRFTRFEGWILDSDRPLPGTMPLRRYLSASGTRHLTTADPRLLSRLGATGWVEEAVEGHIIIAPTHPENVPDVYEAISGGACRVRPTGLVRVTVPYSVDDVNRLVGRAALSRFDASIVRAAEGAGFSFAPFAVGGVVRPDNLTIISVIPTYDGVTGGGQERDIDVDLGSIRVRARYFAANERGDVNLFAHELFHTLGFDQHLYGPGYALNANATFFAGSNEFPGPGAAGLDPWHRMKAGWTRPNVIRLTDPGSNFGFRPESDTVLLFWRPNPRPMRFFLVEYRASGHGGPEWFDGAISAPGLAVWYTETNLAHDLVTFEWPPPFDAPSPRGTMYAHYVAGAKFRPGVFELWRSKLVPTELLREGFPSEISPPRDLVWGDGTPTSYTYRVRNFGQTIWLQWEPQHRGFIPRLDRIVEAPPTGLGGPLRLSGVFPLDGVVTEVRGPDGIEVSIPVSASSNPRYVDVVAPPLDRGRHEVTVRGWALPQLTSNALTWE